ncbi:MAG: hypothetical protein ACLQG3_19690 [Terracidiphilus sp.]
MGNAFGNPGTDPGDRLTDDQVRHAAELHRAAQARQQQALQLQRENILSQRTSNPNRRAALEAALDQIEAQLQAIG